MRLTKRAVGHLDYWKTRWDNVGVDTKMINESVYPLKYALDTFDIENHKNVLEAGCGPGRVLKYFENMGVVTVGFDYVGSILVQLKKESPCSLVCVSDVLRLPFLTKAFDCIFAFGLLHNLQPRDVRKGLFELNRVTSDSGKLCASFRADNLNNYLNDLYFHFKNFLFLIPASKLQFHKINFTKAELIELYQEAGFEILYIVPAQNMPIIFKFRLFRKSFAKQFDEKLERTTGYRLNSLGLMVNRLLSLFPNQFCSVYVVQARKIRKLSQ